MTLMKSLLLGIWHLRKYRSVLGITTQLVGIFSQAKNMAVRTVPGSRSDLVVTPACEKLERLWQRSAHSVLREGMLILSHMSDCVYKVLFATALCKVLGYCKTSSVPPLLEGQRFSISGILLLLASFYHVPWASVPFIPGTIEAHGRTPIGFPLTEGMLEQPLQVGRRDTENKEHVETRAPMVPAHPQLLPFISLPSQYLITD